MGWLFGKYKDPAHPFGTDNPPPASPGIEAAIRRLEQRRGYPVRDGEHVLPWWPWSERGD